MLKWAIRKLGQLAKWASDTQTIVQENEESFSAWSLADFGAGVAVGAGVALIFF
ncbi:MAG: hypothetical protein E6X17_14725 [Sporomusaceae bacterium]|nr:hypothetical protein [Sporomusaceae bacterium]